MYTVQVETKINDTFHYINKSKYIINVLGKYIVTMLYIYPVISVTLYT